MAINTQNFLDLSGLTRYDGKIKDWSNSIAQAGIKTVLKTADGNSLKFYKKPNAVLTDTADFTIELGSSEAATKLAALAETVGATWDSANSQYVIDLDSSLEATNVVDAINEVISDFNAFIGEIPSGASATTVIGYISEVIAGLDVNEFATATKDASTNVVTIHGVKEIDGKVAVGTTAANDVVLAAVAATGDAADVAYDNTTSGLTATDAQSAIDEVAAAAQSGVESKTVYLQDESAGQSAYAKVYKLYQGANAPSAQTDPATLIGTINIPKDLVVQSGKIVTVTNGVDSDGETTSVADGTYIKLTIQNQTEKLYINVADLVDAYTGGTTATATVSISAANEITVDVIDVIYKAESAAGARDGETVKEALTRLDGNNTVEGSVAKKVKDAVDALDGTATVATATMKTVEGSQVVDYITIKGSVKETNGIIGNDATVDDVQIGSISTASIDALFA